MCRTSQEVVTPEEIEFQLGLYALFVKLAQGYIPRTFFVDLGNATVEEFPADEEKVEVVAEKLKDILTGIRSGDFEVSQKKEHCAKCDYSGTVSYTHLIRLLGREASVFVVGDPRQSIYQWRGSDERFFEEFEKCFPGAVSYTHLLDDLNVYSGVSTKLMEELLSNYMT